MWELAGLATTKSHAVQNGNVKGADERKEGKKRDDETRGRDVVVFVCSLCNESKGRVATQWEG